MDSYSMAASMRKMIPPPPLVPTNHNECSGKGRTSRGAFPSHDGMLVGSGFCRFCAGDHSSHEYIQNTASHSSPLHPAALPTSSSAVSPEP